MNLRSVGVSILAITGFPFSLFLFMYIMYQFRQTGFFGSPKFDYPRYVFLPLTMTLQCATLFLFSTYISPAVGLIYVAIVAMGYAFTFFDN